MCEILRLLLNIRRRTSDHTHLGMVGSKIELPALSALKVLVVSLLTLRQVPIFLPVVTVRIVGVNTVRPLTNLRPVEHERLVLSTVKVRLLAKRRFVEHQLVRYVLASVSVLLH